MGDFNHGNIKWDSLQSTGVEDQRFLCLVQDNFLTQHVLEPTTNYLDFQKAFDKVPHQRLILKLKSHGMGNSIINWIEQWLNDRRQRVVVDEEVSSWKPFKDLY